MNNEELIEALRWCPSHGCGRCVALDGNGRCTLHGVVGLMSQAADLIEAQAKRIAELEAQPPKWISVEDRLPEKMKNILAANNRGKQWDIDKAWYNGAYFDRCGKRPLCHVTHWMPLPEPPKGE